MFRIASAAIAAVGLVVLAVTPAHAEVVSPQSASQCSNNQYCGWSGIGWTGSYTYSSSCSAGGTTKLVSWQGGGKSAVNNTGNTVYLRYNGSTVAVLGPGGSVRSTTFDAMTCYT